MKALPPPSRVSLPSNERHHLSFEGRQPQKDKAGFRDAMLLLSGTLSKPIDKAFLACWWEVLEPYCTSNDQMKIAVLDLLRHWPRDKGFPYPSDLIVYLTRHSDKTPTSTTPLK